ncbi:MAG: hypothetical protein ACRDVL_02255 [Acidimicrobiia bacterium]
MAGEHKNEHPLEEEREEAEEVELEEDSTRKRLVEREAAEGVEVFESPESSLPGPAIRDGEPERESLTGDRLGLQPEDGDEPAEEEENEES